MALIDLLLRRVSADAPDCIATEISAEVKAFDNGDSVMLRIEGSQVGMVSETEVEPAVTHAASLLQDYIADRFAVAWPELVGTGVLDVQTTANGIAAWVRGDDVEIPVGELREWTSAHGQILIEPGA